MCGHKSPSAFRKTNRPILPEAGDTPELKTAQAHGQTMPSDFEIATEEPRSAVWGPGHSKKRGRGLTYGESLPEQRPNAGGAKAESQEALEVTAEKYMFRDNKAEILFRCAAPVSPAKKKKKSFPWERRPLPKHMNRKTDEEEAHSVDNVASAPAFTQCSLSPRHFPSAPPKL